MKKFISALRPIRQVSVFIGGNRFQIFAFSRKKVSDKMFSNRDLRALLIPLIIEQLLNAFMGIADTMMVSNVGPAAISGVSLVDSINNLIIFIFSALATGGTIVCSQYLGRGDRKGANHAARQLMLSVLALSIVLTAVCVPLRDPLIKLIFGSVEKDVFDASSVYLLITALSFPFIALFSASSALFRSEAISRIPMQVSITMNIINVVLNAVFIFAFGLGVAGAALATLISRLIGAVTLLYIQHKPGRIIIVNNFASIRPDVSVIRLIMRIGIPTGLENGLFHFGKLVVQSIVSTLGTAAIAANAMVSMLEFIASMPGMAIGLGLLTVAGQCMGAGKPEEARRYTIKFTVLTEIVLIIMLVVVVLITKPVTILARMTPESAALTWKLVVIISLAKLVPWSLSFTLPNGMRAAGDVRYSMLVSTISMWLFRVALSYMLCIYFEMGLIGVWIGMFVDWFCRAIFFLGRFFSGAWQKKTVLDT